MPPSAKDEAIRLLAARNFHQCLWIPANASHGKLRVTYATTSNFDDETLPVILFHVPLFGSRYLAFVFDKIIRDSGVRLACIDRPGFGGSTPVPLDQQMPVWLETVPLLLERLNVKHVSLVAHSAGTLYLLNTLCHYREILDPRMPYVALLAPWVHSDHSNAGLMAVASKLPKAMIKTFGGLNQFMIQQIAPMASWSGGIVSSLSNLFQNGSDSSCDSTTDAEQRYGVSQDVAKELEKLRTEYIFAEGIDGINDDCLFCLRKTGAGLWGACDDYVKCVQTVSEAERKRLLTDPSSPRLKIDFFYAESDLIIGKGGQDYMRRIWSADGVSDAVDVQSRECEGTDHESLIVDLTKGALPLVLKHLSDQKQGQPAQSGTS